MNKIEKKNYSIEAYKVKAYKSLLMDLSQKLSKLLEKDEVTHEDLREVKMKIDDSLRGSR